MRELLATLRNKVAQMQGTAVEPGQDFIPSGSQPLDGLLPRGGFSPGTLIEWIAERSGSAAGTLALLAAREAARRGGYIVVVDHQRSFYPPAAALWGVDLRRMLIIRADKPADEMWAIDQALRCEAVAAVWAPISHLDRQLDTQWLRRWQLAAERSGALGLLVRSSRALGAPTWADAQLQVSPVAGRGDEETWEVKVELLKVRGGAGGGVVQWPLGAPRHVGSEAS